MRLMTTVQIAIKNSKYALALRNLLAREGYKVLIVQKPDLAVPGLIVLADSWLPALDTSQPERLIVVASQQGASDFLRFWRAGLRNVIFANDSPQVAYLAVLAANMRSFSKPSRSAKYSILSTGVTSLEENGLKGPFALTDRVIDEEVGPGSPGVFALDDMANGTGFHIVFVGRSDIDVNNQLHVYVGAYKRFKFHRSASPQAAFDEECALFHDFVPRDNAIHPRRPARSDWICPRCKLFG
jgi:hypothetical protein